MDGDPKVSSELDNFSLTFPLPYRVGFLVLLGVWGWGLNLQYLSRVDIELPTLIQYPGRTSATQPPHHLSTYRLATVLSALFGLSITIFWLCTRRTAELVIQYDWLPLTFLCAVVAVFFVPLRDFTHHGRTRFLHSLRRVSVGGIAQAKEGKFGDILLADALTSYSKVFGDLYVVVCMFFRTDGAATARPDRGCGGTVAVPLIMAIPFAIRFRQCVIEYLRVRRGPYKESAGWGGQHLANAAKYSTAFPVIILGALQRSRPADQPSQALNRAWLLAVLLNSLYSFYWDVTKDWDLTLLAPSRERKARDHAYGLRRHLVFRAPFVYYFVIGMDLVLRCTWTLKLSARLDHLSDFEGSIFLLQFLEVFRRWVWIFFRVETEYIRELSSGAHDPEGVLLDDVDPYESDGEF